MGSCAPVSTHLKCLEVTHGYSRDMVEGSSLTVELYEKRLTHPDRCLGTIVLSSDEIWSRWEISEGLLIVTITLSS